MQRTCNSTFYYRATNINNVHWILVAYVYTGDVESSGFIFYDSLYNEDNFLYPKYVYGFARILHNLYEIPIPEMNLDNRCWVKNDEVSHLKDDIENFQ